MQPLSDWVYFKIALLVSDKRAGGQCQAAAGSGTEPGRSCPDVVAMAAGAPATVGVHNNTR